MSAQPTLVRLQRFIAQAGIAARRKAEDLITSGRVTVDGVVVTELGTKVDPSSANVQVDGEPVAPQDHFYIVFNKPKGCITAVSDDRGRLTVMEYLPNLPVTVAPVGRLDFYSEGVLLLTNDGELAAKLLAPGSHVPKTYHVKVEGDLKPTDLERLRTGVTLDDGTTTAPAEVSTLPADSRHAWLAITLYEGKSRQIHRMLETLGHRVIKLQRVAFANLTFHGLRVGDARELAQAELNDLRELVGLDRRAASRGRWSATREATDRTRAVRAQKAAEAAEAAALAGGTGDYDGDDEEALERELEARTSGGRAAGRPVSAARPSTRPVSGARPSSRPVSGARPSARPVSGARPSARPVSGARPSARPVSGGYDERPARPGRPSAGGDRPVARGSYERPASGGYGGRPASGGRPAAGGDRPVGRGGYGDRPLSGGRPAAGGDRPAGRGGFGGRPASGGGRPAAGGDRPARGGYGDRPSSGGRPAAGGDRPARGGYGDRPSSGGRPAAGGDRPARGGFGGRPASTGGRPSSGSGRPSSGGGRPSSGSGRPSSGGRPATGGGRPTKSTGPRRGASRPVGGKPGRKGPPRR